MQICSSSMASSIPIPTTLPPNSGEIKMQRSGEAIQAKKSSLSPICVQIFILGCGYNFWTEFNCSMQKVIHKFTKKTVNVVTLFFLVCFLSCFIVPRRGIIKVIITAHIVVVKWDERLLLITILITITKDKLIFLFYFKLLVRKHLYRLSLAI